MECYPFRRRKPTAAFVMKFPCKVVMKSLRTQKKLSKFPEGKPTQV